MTSATSDEIMGTVFYMLTPFLAWVFFAVIRRRVSLRSFFVLLTIEAVLMTILRYTHPL